MRYKRDICILLAVICLAACSDKKTDPAETYSTDASTSASVTTETTLSLQEAAWQARLEYDGSGLEEIPSVNICIVDDHYDLSLNDPDYPELSEAVTSLYDDERSSFQDEHPELDRYSDFVFLKRCDNRILSYYRHMSVSDEDLDDIYASDVYRTFDHEGNLLMFSDVISDYDELLNVIEPLILSRYDPEYNYPQLDVEDAVNRFRNIADPDDIFFYMSDNSIWFTISGCRMINSNGDPTEDEISCTVELEYEEYAYVIKPQYLPGTGTMLCEPFPCTWALFEPDLEGSDYPYSHGDDVYPIEYDGTWYSNVAGDCVLRDYRGHDYAVITLIAGNDTPRVIYVYDMDSGELLSYEAVWEDRNPPLGTYIPVTDYIDHILDE